MPKNEIFIAESYSVIVEFPDGVDEETLNQIDDQIGLMCDCIEMGDLPPRTGVFLTCDVRSKKIAKEVELTLTNILD